MTLPSVSIVVVNLNGRHHFEQLFRSLRAVDYPAELLEIVVVDNGSVDGSVQWLDRNAPDARTIQCRQNHGFAGGINVGVEASQGEVLVFLNTDMRVEPNWLRELVAPIATREADCTSSLTLSWNGKEVNFGGSAMNFHGIGWQVGMNDPEIDRYRKPCDTLFACGGSMAIRREVYEDAGRFDEEFFAYYEDVDLGFRLWVLGYRVLYVPSSLAYHHHMATSRRIDVHKIRLLQMRNPLWLIYKNYEESVLQRVLPAALLVHQKRMAYVLHLDDHGYRIDARDARGKGRMHELALKMRASKRSVGIPPPAKADMLAINDFSMLMDAMAVKRKSIQSRRKRPDRRIVPLFRIPFWAVEDSPEFAHMIRALMESFRLDEIFGTREVVIDPRLARDR
jgi:GT2 family glycosyltransferase